MWNGYYYYDGISIFSYTIGGLVTIAILLVALSMIPDVNNEALDKYIVMGFAFFCWYAIGHGLSRWLYGRAAESGET